MSKRTIAVFCGAASGNDPVFAQAALDVADWLVAHDYALMYGGGKFGLMGTLAKRVLDLGGAVHGIMPANLVSRGAALEGLTSLSVAPDMAVRKKQMLEQSDACIALPGGPGTLEEISEAYSWSRIGDNPNPCVVYNVAHYYDPLAAMYQQMVTHDFLSADAAAKLLFSADLSEVDAFINGFEPAPIRTYPQSKS